MGKADRFVVRHGSSLAHCSDAFQVAKLMRALESPEVVVGSSSSQGSSCKVAEALNALSCQLQRNIAQRLSVECSTLRDGEFHLRNAAKATGLSSEARKTLKFINDVNKAASVCRHFSGPWADKVLATTMEVLDLVGSAQADNAFSPLGKMRPWRNSGEEVGSSTPSQGHYSHKMRDDSVSRHEVDVSYVYHDPAEINRNHARRTSGKPGSTPAATPRSSSSKSESEADNAFPSDLKKEAPTFVPGTFREDVAAAPVATNAATTSAAVHYYAGDNEDMSRDSESEAALTRLFLTRYKSWTANDEAPKAAVSAPATADAKAAEVPAAREPKAEAPAPAAEDPAQAATDGHSRRGKGRGASGAECFVPTTEPGIAATDGASQERYEATFAADYDHTSHEAYLASLSVILGRARSKSSEEWRSLFDSLVRSPSALRAAYYEGKHIVQFLQDIMKASTTARVAPSSDAIKRIQENRERAHARQKKAEAPAPAAAEIKAEKAPDAEASSVTGLPLFDCTMPSRDGVQEEDAEVQPGLRSNSQVPLAATLSTSTLPSRYDFHETNDELEGDSEREITVHIEVPPSTVKEQVFVKFRRNSLLVKVALGCIFHKVIDGELQGCIDPEASSWTLQGSGPDRILCLTLEKSKGGIKWHQLLKQADTNCSAPAVAAPKTLEAASYSSN